MSEINRVVDWEIRDVMLDKARFRGPDGLSLKTSVTTNGEVARVAHFAHLDNDVRRVRRNFWSDQRGVSSM